jgi:hypothetical protein
MIEDQPNVVQMVSSGPTTALEGVKAGLFFEMTNEDAIAFLNQRLPGRLG